MPTGASALPVLLQRVGLRSSLLSRYFHISLNRTPAREKSFRTYRVISPARCTLGITLAPSGIDRYTLTIRVSI